MRIIKIHRYNQDRNQTLSTLTVFDEHHNPLFTSIAIERGWNDNKRNTSCIPVGAYNLELEYSNRFKKDLWEIKGVDNRSECKIHSSNYWYQLNGCIAPGISAIDIDKDGYLDVTRSKTTLKELHNVMQPFTKAKIIIVAECGLN